MADIEEDFLSRDHKAKTAFKTPPFIPRRVLKDLGTEKIMGDRYFSHKFMRQEWEKVWKKNLALRYESVRSRSARRFLYP